MTDDEIIKALECCSDTTTESCNGCPFLYNCKQGSLKSIALDLIKRQKAEIEALKDSIQQGNEICENCQSDKNKGLLNARKNAVREFAERLEETKFKIGSNYFIYADNIKVVVKEMVGEKNA